MRVPSCIFSARSNRASAGGFKCGLVMLPLLGMPYVSFASAFDMRPGVTEMSMRIQEIHHMALWVCIVVGVIVFGAMFYSIFAHRRSKNPVPAKFKDSVLVEVIWTLIPVLILIGMAIPATTALIEIEDNDNSELTVLITGSQWKWHYEYLGTDISYYSNTATPDEQINNHVPKGEHYLLEVDEPLVLPTGKKIRFLTTADDVIHSWWIPDIAVKQDAIPGFINESWAEIPVAGVYRGQCAELCGIGHAYMPIVADVIPEAEFDGWLEEQRIAQELAGDAAVAARSRTWSMEELMPMGEEVYVKNCATCHQRDGAGQGSNYPALAGSVIAIGPIEDHLETVLNGVTDTEMQAWAPQLSDLEIAAVITYERNSWGNNVGDIIQPLTVFEAR